MALTKDFKDTIKNRVEKDGAFREELLKEGIECLLAGDVDTGKAVLRDYIKATMGFESLGEATDRSPKSLDSLKAIEGDTARRSSNSSFTVWRETPNFWARPVVVRS